MINNFRHYLVVKWMAICIMAYLLLFVPNYALAGDLCSDILLGGLQDRFVVDKNGSLSDNLESWFKSDKFGEYVREHGDDFSLSFPIPKIGILGFGSNNRTESMGRLKHLVDTGKIRSLSKNQSSYLLAQFVSKNRVDAWRDCMSGKSKQRGSVVSRHEIRDDGQIVIIYIDYIPITQADKLPEIENHEIIGGEVVNDYEIVDGCQIDYTGKVVLIKRKPESFITFSISTTRGNIVETIKAMKGQTVIQSEERETVDYKNPLNAKGFILLTKGNAELFRIKSFEDIRKLKHPMTIGSFQPGALKYLRKLANIKPVLLKPVEMFSRLKRGQIDAAVLMPKKNL